MKIAVIADIHIGARSDIKNYYDNELVFFIEKINKID